MPVDSVAFTATGLGVGRYLNLDFFMPIPQPEYFWTGDVRVMLSCPSIGVSGQQIGNVVPMTYLFEGEFNSLMFEVPTSLRTALNSGARCTISPIVNVSRAVPGTFGLDKMGFVDNL